MRHPRQTRYHQCASHFVHTESACGVVCQGIPAAYVLTKLGAAKAVPEALAVAAAQCPRTCSWRGAFAAP